MLRRNPTRIELKLEDIKEYETMKAEKLKQIGPKPMALECSSSSAEPTCEGATARPDGAGASGTDMKTKAQLILEMHERIGYDPKPQLGASRVHAPIKDLLRIEFNELVEKYCLALVQFCKQRQIIHRK